METTPREKEFFNFRLRVGLHAISHGPAKTTVSFGTRRGMNRYWRNKLLDPNFHNKRHGGGRYVKFGAMRPVVHALIWAALKHNPLLSIPEVSEFMRSNTNFEVNDQYVARLFKKWKWSTKRPVRHQINKYTIRNIGYYCDFLWGVKDIPWKNLKFLDECHFISRKSYKKKIWCPRGRNIILLNWPDLSASYTLTFMTNLANVNTPFWAGIQENKNNQFTFLGYIYSAIINGALCPGDYLICDNASIHWAEATQQCLGMIPFYFYIVPSLHLY